MEAVGPTTVRIVPEGSTAEAERLVTTASDGARPAAIKLDVKRVVLLEAACVSVRCVCAFVYGTQERVVRASVCVFACVRVLESFYVFRCSRALDRRWRALLLELTPTPFSPATLARRRCPL